MKNLKTLFLLLVFATVFISCDNNDELIVNPKSKFDAEILVTSDGVDNKLAESIDITNKHDLKVRVTYKSIDETMRRLYITVDTLGRGAVPFKLILKDGTKVDLKGDGSIDLEQKYKKGFDFEFDIKAPNNITDGTVVYKFWTTSGKGDFRDDTKRKKLKVSTITLNYGNATTAAQMKSFTAKLLAAPLADATSKTFISLFDGKVYKISEGAEYAAFWDFGFFYGKTYEASLCSVSDYPEVFTAGVFPVLEDGDVFNVVKFKLSEVTVSEFTAIVESNELDFIDASSIKDTRIKHLEVGNVIEFVNNYNKKGLIRVLEINPSAGTKGYIKIDVKMQA